MKSRESLLRLKRFQVEERKRRVGQIEIMVADFSRMANELEREIAIEEQKSGITDQTHFAYPTYARAARIRRENLVRSASELKDQLAEAKALFDEATAEFIKAQGIENRYPSDGKEKGAERAAFPAHAGMIESQFGFSAA